MNTLLVKLSNFCLGQTKIFHLEFESLHLSGDSSKNSECILFVTPTIRRLLLRSDWFICLANVDGLLSDPNAEWIPIIALSLRCILHILSFPRIIIPLELNIITISIFTWRLWRYGSQNRPGHDGWGALCHRRWRNLEIKVYSMDIILSSRCHHYLSPCSLLRFNIWNVL